MDKHIKIKLITTIICLLVSVIALYSFVFVIDVSNGWRIALIIIAISWIISGVSNIVDYLKK